jgi:hypothetical protein
VAAERAFSAGLVGSAGGKEHSRAAVA